MITKTAALLKDKRGVFFKVIIINDKPLLRKFRILKDVRRLGFNSFRVPFTDSVVAFLEGNKFEFNGAFKRLKQIQW